MNNYQKLQAERIRQSYITSSPTIIKSEVEETLEKGIEETITKIPKDLIKSTLLDTSSIEWQTLAEGVREKLLQRSDLQKSFATLEGDFDLSNPNSLIKGLDRAGLSAKKVQIHAKDGSTHWAIRWVQNGTDDSPTHSHKSFKDAGKEVVGNNDEEKLKHIVHSSKTPQEKLRDLVHMGIYDKGKLEQLSGASAQEAYDQLYHAGIKTKDFKKEHDELKTSTGEKAPAGGAEKELPAVDTTSMSTARDLLSKNDFKKFSKNKKAELAAKYGVTVNDRWDAYEQGVMQVITLGAPKSILAFGTGGVGKTYVLSNKDKTGVLDRLGLEKFDPDIHDKGEPGQWDWCEIGGSMSKTDSWDILYANKDKTVVFDDCDSMWEDPAYVNILKKILDSSGDGLVSYSGSKTKDEDGQKVTQFKFTGKVVFISNLTRSDLEAKGAGPIVSSRSMAIDLTMTRDETIERIENLKDNIKIRDGATGTIIPIGTEERDFAIAALKEFKDDISDDQLNVRVFNNLASKAHFLKKQGKLNPENFMKQAYMALL